MILYAIYNITQGSAYANFKIQQLSALWRALSDKFLIV